MRRTDTLVAIAALCLVQAPAADALVHLDKGRRMLNGVQLLQDYNDEKRFFYVPQFPRLAQKPDGSFELLCLKYVGKGGKSNGGLFHALVEFTLPPELLKELEEKLEEEVPGAVLAGPVDMLEAVEEGEEAMGSFQVVSAILTDKGEGGFTRNMITSGHAPFTPGSKAVVAAILNQEGASLLWDSFTGPTSDVSVSVSGYYEAAVQAYNAKVTAEMEVIYKHFSRIENRQKGYTKRQLRNIVDDLQKTGDLKIEVMDRSKSLGIDAKDMDGILQLVTDKLTELMFDSESGWSKDPEREQAVEAQQIQGRQERGWFSKTFGGAEDTPYFTDDQWVLKNREDIRRNKFTLTLDKSTTIKVPVHTSGNLGGIFDKMGSDERYFRIVNLDDPDFEFRRVHFQVDGSFLDSFQDTINFVTVNFRKTYRDRPAHTQALQFTHADVKEGRTVQEAAFPRLGSKDAGWVEYEYQLRWSLRDGPTISIPTKEDQWIKSVDAAVSLVPPFTKRLVEFDADRSLFALKKVSTGVLEFATVLGGQPKLQKKATLRAADAESAGTVSVYVDRDEPVAYRLSWYAPGRKEKGALQLLDSDFLFIEPPAPPDGGEEAASTAGEGG
jgi:hypothetical protein